MFALFGFGNDEPGQVKVPQVFGVVVGQGVVVVMQH
jgi:hypothetical protein